MSTYHTSVLLQEVSEYLNIAPGEKYIDATLGGGGHALEIVKRGGIVLGIDVDQEAITYVKKILRDRDIRILSEKKDEARNITVSQYPNITLLRGNFADIDTIARSIGFDKVQGILFDLGVSSHQLESPTRGFSYLAEGPLDMRMDTTLSVRAEDLLKILTKGELYDLFYRLGEERHARAIADSIIRARGVMPIKTTGQLTALLLTAYGIRHPTPKMKAIVSKRVFQALRIAVNDELGVLEEALPKALSLLEKKGRLVVISFHSLEDRIVKHAFRRFAEKNVGRIVTKRPIGPSEKEEKRNVSSRSSKLRVFEKL